jgi:hypothetical protein
MRVMVKKFKIESWEELFLTYDYSGENAQNTC